MDSFSGYCETAYLLRCTGPGHVGHLAMWDVCRIIIYFTLFFVEKSLPEKLDVPPGYVGQLGWAVERPTYPWSNVRVYI